jgi:hypothetical protein
MNAGGENGAVPMPIVYERARVNVFNITGFVFVLLVQVAGGTTIWVNLTRDVAEIRAAQEDIAATADKNSTEVKSQIAPIPDLRFQQSRQAEQIEDLKTAVVDTNKRFDRMIELLSGKLDGLTVSMNDLRTDVRVLTQEVRSKQGEVVRPTAFGRP